MQSLEAILNTITRHWNEKDGTLLVMGKFHPPAFWVIISCLIEKFEYELTEVNFEYSETKGYSSAIGFDKVTDKKDLYRAKRINEHINYSCLELLKGKHTVDSVTSSITSCVRNFFNEPKYQFFVNELNKVIGELHDNVDAHSGKPSFSLIQKSRTVRNDDDILEFCIADTGIGFKKSMELAFIPVGTDIDAIKWCTVKGNTTKPRDPWEQNNPEYAGPINHRHHLGLGLPALVNLIRKFKGELWLASGKGLFKIKENQEEFFVELKNHWQGVAISFRFKLSCLAMSYNSSNEEVSELIF